MRGFRLAGVAPGIVLYTVFHVSRYSPGWNFGKRAAGESTHLALVKNMEARLETVEAQLTARIVCSPQLADFIKD